MVPILCALALAAAASGIWVSAAGRPLRVGPFALHKLTALAGAVLAVLLVRRGAPASPAVILLLAASFVAALVTGGVLSFRGPLALRLAHGAAALGWVGSLAAFLVLRMHP